MSHQLRDFTDPIAPFEDREPPGDDLHQSETRLALVLAASGTGVWEWNIEANCLVASPETREILGIASELGTFEAFSQAVHPEDMAGIIARAEQAIAERTIFAQEFRVCRPDGEVRWISGQGQPQFDASGNPLRFVGTICDITDRKRAEEALRESEERFRLTFDQSPIGSAIVSLDYRYVRVNEILCRITGYSSEELTGLHFPDITHPDDVPKDVEFAERLAAGEIDHYEMDKRYIRKDRGVVWIHLVVRMIRSAAGEPLYFLPTMQDITEKRQAVEALRRSEKIQAEAEKLAVTSRMAAVVAHEINNPLAGIKNAFHLIKDAVPPDHPHRDMVRRIEREIDRMARIVRQMYQIYAPRVEEVIDIPVAEIVRDVRELIEPLCREHGVAVELGAIPPELTVRAYEGSLQQVLFNLVANAIQASPRAAVVRVIAGLADEDYVRISILDRGPGIPAEVQARMFEPFVSADVGGTAKHGLGLGLAIVKNIVESLLGRIIVESKGGEGTCFHLDLPSKQSKEY